MAVGHARGAHDDEVWETCEIKWWQGYLKSEFFAVGVRPGAEAYEAHRSPMFRWWHRSSPPQKGRIAAAHQVLVDKLVADGWEPVGRGGPWYAQRFRRLLFTSLPAYDEPSTEPSPQGEGAADVSHGELLPPRPSPQVGPAGEGAF